MATRWWSRSKCRCAKRAGTMKRVKGRARVRGTKRELGHYRKEERVPKKDFQAWLIEGPATIRQYHEDARDGRKKKGRGKGLAVRFSKISRLKYVPLRARERKPGETSKT